MYAGDLDVSLANPGFAPDSGLDFALSLRQWSGSGLQPDLVPGLGMGSSNSWPHLSASSRC